jgi:hypothetical protein
MMASWLWVDVKEEAGWGWTMAFSGMNKNKNERGLSKVNRKSTIVACCFKHNHQPESQARQAPVFALA